MLPHRYSVASVDSSSYQPSSRSSSSSNGRLTPASTRLSVRIPSNAPFIPSLSNPEPRPGSSLSGDWSDADPRAAAEGGEADEWADEEGERERRSSSLDGAEESIRAQKTPIASTSHIPYGVRSSPRHDDHDSEPPRTPITFPPAGSSSSPQQHSRIDSASSSSIPTDHARDSFPSSEESGGFGLGFPDSTLSQRSRLMQIRSIDNMRERAEEGMTSEEDEETRRWKDSQRQMAHAALSRIEDRAQVPSQDLPFPSLTDVPPPVADVPSYAPPGSTAAPHVRIRPDAPSLASTASRPDSAVSPRSSALSTATSNSSTLSLPSTPPVDLTLPNRPNGTFVSVASGPMALLAADSSHSSGRPQSRGGPRTFLSNLLTRSPRSPNLSPSIPSASSSPSTSPDLAAPRSPSAPTGFQNPSVGSLQSSEGIHSRSNSMPTVASPSRMSSEVSTRERRELESSPRRTPRNIAATTLAGLARSSSLRAPSSPSMITTSSSTSHQLSNSSSHLPPGGPFQFGARPSTSPAPTVGFAALPLPTSPDMAPPPPPATLKSIGLSLVPLTQPLSLSRNAQPLCGALLDDKYLLIGTSAGLDFIPLPLPGSLPMPQHGTKKRKETRKPITLIKRTRFKELAVLSERSNILLAIAGRNDHIRVYALDGIRAMIEKKMQEVDIKDGYPIIQDAVILTGTPSSNSKGKARATPSNSTSTSSSASAAPSSSRPQSTFPPQQPPLPTSSYRFPLTSSPPDYSDTAPSARRRPPSVHQATSGSLYAPASSSSSSPVRSPARSNSATSGSFVRAIPTNPTSARGSISSQITATPGSPRSLRGSKSREFVASRRSSSATVQRRRSRADLNVPPLPSSRRGSLVSLEPGQSQSASVLDGRSEAAGEGEESEVLHTDVYERPSVPSSSLLPNRRPSATSNSGGTTGSTLHPSPIRKLEARAATQPQTPLHRSPTADLAEFLRHSGPEMYSREMDRTIASSRSGMAGRSNSVTASLMQMGSEAQLSQKPQTSGTLERSHSLQRPATTSRLREPSAIRQQGDQEDDEDLELLQSPAASFANSRRRSSLNDPNRPQARSPTSRRLGLNERSPVLELAGFIRQTGPNDHPAHSPPSASRRSSASRPAPREAYNPRLGRGEKSPSMELAAMLKETGPEDVSPGSSPVQRFSTLPRQQQQPSVHSQRSLGRSRNEDLADFSDPFVGARRGSAASLVPPRPSPRSGSPTRPDPPRRASSHRLVARSAVATPPEELADETDSEVPMHRKNTRQTLIEAIVSGPPTASTSSGLGISSSMTSMPDSNGGSPRSNKRWTMSGMFNRPATSSGVPSVDGHYPRPLLNRPTTAASPQNNDPHSIDRRRSSAQWEVVSHPDRPAESAQPTPPSSSPPQLAPTAESSSAPFDSKRRPEQSLHPTETPQLAPGSQAPPDAHPANSASPLEYVKLARTKGARLLRAVETKKRTYLAVLCGEDGERIELFTGSRSISLSLNRTFVLPETPRTIEFQLQGDDLVDIYLIYPESIFALEPATVRVREVGVGRGERRARREQERRMQDVSASTVTEDVRAPSLHSALHPADPALQEAQNDPPMGDDEPPAPEDFTIDISDVSPLQSPSPLPVPRDAALPPFSTADPQPATPAYLAAAGAPSATHGAPRPPAPPRPLKPSIPYTTFQQLPFVPPVPSSVLSSAWTIPPLYTDVVAGSPAPHSPSLDDSAFPHPSITATGGSGSPSANGHDPAAGRPFGAEDLPLLSPISLLGGAALRANGPPGLFFVSKGKSLTSIVTADGKSIIKRPLVWSHEKLTTGDESTEIHQRIELLVVGGTKTVVVKVGASDVKAIAVEGSPSTNPFSSAVSASPTSSRPVIQFLSTHSASQQLLFAQTVGQSWTIQCLASTSS
ncbi:hypothetical protein JCM1840_005717 [Sporobolomyces johnsonii]